MLEVSCRTVVHGRPVGYIAGSPGSPSEIYRPRGTLLECRKYLIVVAHVQCASTLYLSSHVTMCIQTDVVVVVCRSVTPCMPSGGTTADRPYGPSGTRLTRRVRCFPSTLGPSLCSISQVQPLRRPPSAFMLGPCERNPDRRDRPTSRRVPLRS